MAQPDRSVLFAPSLLVGSMLSLTLGATLAKGLFPILGAAGTTVARLAVAAVLLSAIFRPWRARIARPKLGIIAAYGIILGLMNLSFYEAIARLPLGIAIALEFLGPLSIAFILSKGKLDILWAVLALLGVGLILPITKVQAHLDVVGIVFALLAALAWASYILIGKKAGSAAPSGMVTAIGLAIATLTVTPFGISALDAITWPMVGTIIAMSVLSSAIPYSLEMTALKHLDSKTFGILLSLEPAFGAFTAFLFLKEHLTLIQCTAITLVVTASIGSTLTARKQSKELVVN